ncbi:hypothetical protein NDU88_000853 [Pleurodeles waltl]|uniref:Uncharacterized protein n=1 Tax=Pleurodeles waltl TaxID=8319 RepID=A0AAV7V8B1_PLEWA|nr:hypothetical protein NDU88_000853 [Pleurodeles waltl]
MAAPATATGGVLSNLLNSPPQRPLPGAAAFSQRIFGFQAPDGFLGAALGVEARNIKKGQAYREVKLCCACQMWRKVWKPVAKHQQEQLVRPLSCRGQEAALLLKDAPLP